MPKKDHQRKGLAIVSAGNEAVGEKGALSLQPGRAAETGRLSWLEVVEVSSATAAAGEPLHSNFSRLTPLYALRFRILQSGDTKRLDKQHTVHDASMSVCCHSPEYVCVSPILAIDEEWQRTQCMPRETCVDVAKELGTDPSMFFKPPCVSVHRFV